MIQRSGSLDFFSIFILSCPYLGMSLSNTSLTLQIECHSYKCNISSNRIEEGVGLLFFLITSVIPHMNEVYFHIALWWRWYNLKTHADIYNKDIGKQAISNKNECLGSSRKCWAYLESNSWTVLDHMKRNTELKWPLFLWRCDFYSFASDQLPSPLVNLGCSA